MRRLAPFILAVALLFVGACSSTGEEPPERFAPEPRPSVGVQLFQYNWRSVARECTEVLGPNDFAFVLLSPAQEHIRGEQWWTSYQPVSYRLDSKLGSREEFVEMVETCSEQGVQVIADAVINHMAGIDGGTGVAGTDFSHYEYPGLYGHDDFHHCDLTPDGNIHNYRDQEQVQTCNLSNLADLATGEPHVQDTIAGFLDELLDVGVAGFRIDAAKHMHVDDVATVLDKVDGDPVVVSEVIRGGGEPVQPEDYLDVGSVFAFAFARDIAGIVHGGSLGLAVDLREGTVPSDRAWTFVTNHDTERGHQTLTYRDGDKFRLASLLMMATDYGTPVLYSGYAFTDRDAGAPQTDGMVDDVVCATSDEPADGEFICLHEQEVAMAAWRAQVGDAPVENPVWGDGVLMFDRGEVGFVAFSRNDESSTLTVETSLPDGNYCDVLGDDCSITVAEGAMRITVPPMGGLALHVGAMGQG